MANRSGRSGSTAAITNILQSIASKGNDYKDGISVNHMLCKTISERLAINGDLESTLLPLVSDGVISEDEIREFFSNQRNRVKKLAERNVVRERSIDTFVASMNQLSDQVIAADGQEEDAFDENTDFTAVVKGLMDKESSRRKETQLELHEEEYCRQIRQKLGEKEKSKNKRNSDEIEVVRNNDTSANSLKCPIAGVLMEDPVRNRVCGHIYSREGIAHHLQSTGRGRASCPVTGCNNKALTQDQLEDDEETKFKVRRHKKREDLQNEHRIKSQEDMMDEDLEMM